MSTENLDKDGRLCMNENHLALSLQKDNCCSFINIRTRELQEKLEKIKAIQNLFGYERDQVDAIIAMLWSRKKKNNPIGMTFLEIVEAMEFERQSFLFDDNEHLKRLLNVLSLPPIKILDMVNVNGQASFNPTDFGISYLFQGSDNVGI